MIDLFPDNRTLLAFGPFFGLGPFGIRWYALAYIVSLTLGWMLVRRLVRRAPAVATVEQTDDFLIWAALGVVLGGRLGYILFYQPQLFLAQPWTALELWHGGMSFHGGMLGVTTALILFARARGVPLLGFADRIAIVSPMGLGLGRMANFQNGELWGRVAPPGLPWAMVFPEAGPLPRHPSTLYEALLEGVLLLTVMVTLGARERVRARFGLLTGVFLTGYGLARITAEFFREPDAFLGPVIGAATMGQVLSAPMVLAGLGLVLFAQRRRAALA